MSVLLAPRAKYANRKVAQRTSYRARTGNSNGVQKQHTKMPKVPKTHNWQPRLYDVVLGKYL